ncbi:MAG: hypothetical protein Q4A71_04390 [Actinomycetaceae bacterium]|nr:hypothetical protein [Actinomycetaceae bacterium]
MRFTRNQVIAFVTTLAVAVALIIGGGLWIMRTHTDSASPADTAEAGTLADKPLVVIGVTGMRWQEGLRLPEGAMANLVARGCGQVSCPVDGWLTLGMGERQAGDRTHDCQSLPQFLRENPHAATNLSRAFAGSSRSVLTVGPGAAVALPGATHFDLPATTAGITQLLRTNPANFTLVDLGAVGKVPHVRNKLNPTPDDGFPKLDRTTAADATNKARQITEIVSALGPSKNYIIASLADSSDKAHLQAVVVRINNMTGYAKSGSLQRRALLQTSDLTQIILSENNLSSSPTMTGTKVWMGGGRLLSATHRAAYLTDFARKADVAVALQPAFFILWALAFAAAIALTRTRYGTTVGLVAAAMPVSSLLAGYIPTWRVAPTSTLVSVGLGLAGVGVLAIITVIVATRTAEYLKNNGFVRANPGILVGAATVGIYGTVIAVRAAIQLDSPTGTPTIAGNRFYGMGNTEFAIIAAAALLLAYYLRSSRACLVIGVTLVLVDGLAWMGADFGGPPALILGFTLCYCFIKGIRFKIRHALATLTLMVVTPVVLTAVDFFRDPLKRTHIGRFVVSVFNGDAGPIVQRKLHAALGTIVGSWLSVAVVLGIAALVAYLWWRYKGLLPRQWRQSGISVFATLGLATCMNDSGIMILVFGAVMFCALMLGGIAVPTGADAKIGARDDYESLAAARADAPVNAHVGARSGTDGCAGDGADGGRTAFPPSGRPRTLLWQGVCGALVIAILGAWAWSVPPGISHGKPLPPQKRPLYLVLTTEISWDRLTHRGGQSPLTSAPVRANLVPLPVSGRQCSLDAALALNAGQRLGRASVNTLTPDGSCPRLQPAGAGVLKNWQKYQQLQQAGSGHNTLGTLGDALKKSGKSVLAVGAIAPYVVAESNGHVPGKTITAPGLNAELTRLLQKPNNRADLVVIDANSHAQEVQDSPPPEDGEDDAANPPLIDTQIKRTQSVLSALPKQARVIVLSSSHWNHPQNLQTLALLGEDLPYGTVQSASVRQKGLVQVADISATVGQLLGLELDPTKVMGAKAELVNADPHLIPTLITQSERATALRAVRGPSLKLIVTLFSLTMLVLTVGSWHRAGSPLHRYLRLIGRLHIYQWWRNFRGRCLLPPPLCQKLLRFWLLFLGALPLSALLACAHSWWQSADPGAALTHTMFALAALLSLAALMIFRKNAGFTLAVFTAVIYSVDVAAGARGTMDSLFGFSSLVAARFYGANNEVFSLMSVGWLFAAAWLALRFQGKVVQCAVATICVGVLIIIDGAPTLGADFGGILALIPGLGVLLMLLGNVRIRPRNFVALLVLGFAVALVMSVADWLRPPMERTHMGTFIQSVLDGQLSSILATKLGMNLHILATSNMLYVVLTSIVIVWAWAKFVRTPLPQWARFAFISLVATQVCAMVMNDNGIILPAVAAMVAVPTLTERLLQGTNTTHS